MGDGRSHLRQLLAARFLRDGGETADDSLWFRATSVTVKVARNPKPHPDEYSS